MNFRTVATGLPGSFLHHGLLGLVCTLVLACATPDPGPLPPVGSGSAGYEFFNRPGPYDPWSVRIGDWQHRQRAASRVGRGTVSPAAPQVSAPPKPPGETVVRYETLGHRYDAFLSERRQKIAQDVLDWIQGLARNRFIEDGPIDRWPTLREVRKTFGDDCDGLELLTYHALLDLGFPADRVYRAIVMEPESGLHHMVTLWFESELDPWVLDPTETITSRLVRLSNLGSWIPLKVFSESSEFNVNER